MPERSSFDYAIVQVVPHVERDERINAGVILYCRPQSFLDARVELDHQRLRVLAPDADLAEIETHLAVIPWICEGGPAAGPIGKLSQAERFHWLVAPRSTVVQTSAVHSGLCGDPAAALEHLVATMVCLPSATTQPDIDAYERSVQTVDAALSNLHRALDQVWNELRREGTQDTEARDQLAALLHVLVVSPSESEGGVVLLGQGRYEEALVALRRALAANRRIGDVRRDVAAALRVLAQGEGADEVAPGQG
jgi:hypothetical protein